MWAHEINEELEMQEMGGGRVAAFPLVTKQVETTETYWCPLLAKIRALPSPPTCHSPGQGTTMLVQTQRDNTCSNAEVA